MSQSRGSSVKEWFSCVAVVCVLGCVLSPMLNGESRTETSSGQARRIAVAINNYSFDNDDTFPRGSGANGWQPTDGGWMLDIKPYLSGWKKVLVTEDDPKSQATWPSWIVGMPNAFNTSFVANGYMKYDGSGWGMSGVMGLDQASGTGAWMTRGVLRFSEMTNPAETISFAESYNGYPLFLTSNFFTGQTWYDDTSGLGGLIPDPTRDGTPYYVNGIVQTADNRLGGVNGVQVNGKVLFAWADTHIQRRAPLATNPQPTNAAKNRWDALRPDLP